MKFLSKLVCPLGKIPNVDIKQDVFDLSEMVIFKGEWFLIEKNLYKDLHMLNVEMGFEDGIIFKTHLNQILQDISHFPFVTYFDCENKTTYALNDFTNIHKFWPEFMNIGEEEILYLKMKYENDIIFMDYR